MTTHQLTDNVLLFADTFWLTPRVGKTCYPTLTERYVGYSVVSGPFKGVTGPIHYN